MFRSSFFGYIRKPNNFFLYTYGSASSLFSAFAWDVLVDDVLCGSGNLTGETNFPKGKHINCTTPVTGQEVKIVTTEPGFMFMSNVRIVLTGMTNDSQYLGRTIFED